MPKPESLSILWQNEDAIAVAKPAGLATIPGRAEHDSVLERLARQVNLPAAGSADPRVRVVHRLDKETSGVLLFAKHTAAQRHLSHQFQNNAVSKEYLALVCGRPTAQEGEIEAAIARHPASPLKMAVVRHGGRPARTTWRIEEQFRDYTLLRVFPKTGKTHQIRVHLQSIGLPLAVDALYNPRVGDGVLLSTFKRGYRPKPGEEERPLIGRLTLHAERLKFSDMAGATVAIIAEIPKDLRAALSMLRKYGR
jgi:23S rRNA pseudouridine955/2504/2580 synthase/23S rRNA pseudouridine1911/1915/1917 synthase